MVDTAIAVGFDDGCVVLYLKGIGGGRGGAKALKPDDQVGDNDDNGDNGDGDDKGSEVDRVVVRWSRAAVLSDVSESFDGGAEGTSTEASESSTPRPPVAVTTVAVLAGAESAVVGWADGSLSVINFSSLRGDSDGAELLRADVGFVHGGAVVAVLAENDIGSVSGAESVVTVDDAGLVCLWRPRLTVGVAGVSGLQLIASIETGSPLPPFC